MRSSHFLQVLSTAYAVERVDDHFANKRVTFVQASFRTTSAFAFPASTWDNFDCFQPCMDSLRIVQSVDGPERQFRLGAMLH